MWKKFNPTKPLEIRDSNTSPLWIDEIGFGEYGCLGLTICPGKRGMAKFGKYLWNRDLDSDISVLRDWDAGIVLSLMEEWEMEYHGVPVTKMKTAMNDAGIEWLHFPIKDLSVPDKDTNKTWKELSLKLRNHMEYDGQVLVHCLGGLGRTGVVSAMLLIDDHEDAFDAVNIVRQYRPGAIETDEQENYVMEYGGYKI